MSTPIVEFNPPSVNDRQPVGGLSLDRGKRLRVNSGPVRQSVPISVGGGDQTLATPGRCVYVSTTGNLACRLVGDAADSTWSNLPVGWHPLEVSIIRSAGTTIAGNVGL